MALGERVQPHGRQPAEKPAGEGHTGVAEAASSHPLPTSGAGLPKTQVARLTKTPRGPPEGGGLSAKPWVKRSGERAAPHAAKPHSSWRENVLRLRRPLRACFTTPPTWWLSPSTQPDFQQPEQSPGAGKTPTHTGTRLCLLAQSSPDRELQVPPARIFLPGPPGSPRPHVSCPGLRTAPHSPAPAPTRTVKLSLAFAEQAAHGPL